MRTSRWASATLAGATLTAMAVLPTAGAHAAAPGVSVQVGGDSTVNGVSFEGMRFLAPNGQLTVHKGDTITFNFAGFHTATLLPDNTTPGEFAAAHQTGLGGPTSDFSLVLQDTDDTAQPAFELNKNVAFGDPSCGTSTTPCTYDGKSPVNSGIGVFLPTPTWSVTINDQPGASFWVICLVHPGMAMHVSVVADSTATTTQAEIDSAKSSTLASDHEAAAALIPKLETPSRHTTAGGKKVWDAFAGFDGDGWGLDGMFPSVLHIKKGQTVRWHFAQLLGNIHTVTFPKSQAVSLSNQFASPTCEGANGADTGPTAAPPAFCSTGPQDFELNIPAADLLPAGNGSYAGKASGLHSAGVRGAAAPTNAPYDLKFTKTTRKGFKYACIIHGAMMHGTVFVS